MDSLIVVLTALAVYSSEVYCDTLPTKIAKSEDTVLLEKNNSQTMIDKGSFWKNFNLSRRKLEEARNLDSINGINSGQEDVDKRRGRFLSTLSFLTGLGFGGLATAVSSTMKSAKMPQVFGINLQTSKTSPYFAAYYSKYPYAPLLPFPFFYPGSLGSLGIAPMIDAVKPQTSENDITSEVINLFDNRPVDLEENNEDYTDEEKSGNGADARIKLRTKVDRNAEEKGTIRGCKEGQRKQGKETARDREYQVSAIDFQTALDLQAPNQTASNNDTKAKPTKPPCNTTHHHHHHHHHQYPSGYYGGHPQNIHHVEFTTTQPYSQIDYHHVPYEHPTNFYHDDKYNVYPSLNPSYSAPYFSADSTHEYAELNRLYPSGYQLSNISDGFKPLK